MPLSLAVVNRISGALAEELRAQGDAITVASVDAGSGRVELLVAIAGCRGEPCRILLNVNREKPETLEKELRSKLTEALRTTRPER